MTKKQMQETAVNTLNPIFPLSIENKLIIRVNELKQKPGEMSVTFHRGREREKEKQEDDSNQIKHIIILEQHSPG